MNPTVKPALAILAASLPAMACSAPVRPAPSHTVVLSAEAPSLATLRSRIGPPEPVALEAFAGSGATDITPHELSDAEWMIVDDALAKLPELHRRILEQHLVRLSFLDLEAGAGSALTSRVGPDEDSKEFTITLRASLLKETLTDFLDTKEANLFSDNGSGNRIRFDAGAVDALTYVLIHEATHVVDQVMGLTADNASPLMAGTWETVRLPVERYRSSPATRSRFRGGPQIPLGDAPESYRALRQTPFVSFYATAAAPEDVAELFAWAQIAKHYGHGLTLSVLDRAGRIIFRYEPLESPLVRARFLIVDGILSEHALTP